MPRRVRTITPNELARRRGFASGIELAVQEHLKSHNIEVQYEPFKIPYQQPRIFKYTPDFVLPNGIIIETKGYFDSDDRVKHLLIQSQHPDLDIRFVFDRASNKLNKNSTTTYAIWCDKHGFKWAAKLVPMEWMNEKKNERRIDAIKALNTNEKA